MMANSRGVNRPSVARPARLAMSPQDYQKLGLEKGPDGAVGRCGAYRRESGNP